MEELAVINVIYITSQRFSAISPIKDILRRPTSYSALLFDSSGR